MNESLLEVGKPRLDKLAVLTALVLGLSVNCSSTSQTNVIASQGGSSGLGESTAENGGTAAGTSSSSTSAGAGGQGGGAPTGGTGNADCSAGATLVPDLHAACIEDLGQGKLRIRYDFSSSDQGLDWAASTEATVSVGQNALVIDAHNTIGVAIFKKKLHVDKASFSVTLLSGYTTNWYINTIWTGTWNPDAGYGGYHDTTGRGFIINGTKYSPDDVSPIAVGVLHDVTVTQSNTTLEWDQDGTPMTQTVGPLPVTDRSLALGAWESAAAFYNVVFEGTLN
jgi:hypothetical protein